MRMRLMIALTMVLVGCARTDFVLTGNSEFRPLTPGVYEFKTFADTVYPEASPTAEAKRIWALETFLRQNNACLRGYKMTKRQAVLRMAGINGGAYNIYYTVQCN